MTASLYIASVQPFSGKSLAALAVGLWLREAGLRVGYFKPLGTLPHEVRGLTTDEDAYFIASHLDPDAPPEHLCPVLLTPELAARAVRGELEDLRGRIRAAYAALAADREVMVVGGIGTLSRGSLLGISAPAVAELLDARALVLAKSLEHAAVEEVLLARRLLGERMIGVVFNYAQPEDRETLEAGLRSYLEHQGIAVLGLVPRDELLGAVTVGDLEEHLPAKLLCCEKARDDLIVHFVVGAMGVQSAARYFRQLADKAVITGGDRADIQLAALQTATRALVLTGNIHPSGVIVRRAQQLGVPLLLAPHDTLATVERIEGIAGRVRVRESAKVERGRALFAHHVDLDRIRRGLGLRAPSEVP